MAFVNGTRAVEGGAGVGACDKAGGGVDVGDGCLSGVNASWDKVLISGLGTGFTEQADDGGGSSGGSSVEGLVASRGFGKICLNFERASSDNFESGS